MSTASTSSTKPTSSHMRSRKNWHTIHNGHTHLSSAASAWSNVPKTTPALSSGHSVTKAATVPTMTRWRAGFGSTTPPAPSITKAQFQMDRVKNGIRDTPATDLVCPMYPTVDLIEAYAQDPAGDRPLIMCEYAHAMGNGSGNLKEYWDAIRKASRLAGWLYLGLGRSRATQNGRKWRNVLGVRWRLW